MLLGYKRASLSYILYIKGQEYKYKTFEIQKRYGGSRRICAPLDDLKLLQWRLAELLQDCVDEINKNNDRSDDSHHPDNIAHGFKRNRSIVTNARCHRNRRYVFNVDIENFFHSINFGRVRGYFIADRNFQLRPNIATVLAQIACFQNSLPQGSPCSPVISNLIGHIVDIHIVKLAARVGCTYTRYADDLTFSTNNPKFPEQIAIRSAEHSYSWQAGSELTHIIRKCGFSLNAKKTRMQYHDSRQEVTGLVVNRKINVRREYRHKTRAMVHRLLSTGSFDFEQKLPGANGVVVISKTAGTANQLHGMLGFIDGVDLYNKQFYGDSIKKELVYKRFLIFKELYCAPAPVILCEGKTDNVYITHAIRQLALLYPELASIDSQGEIIIKFRRFRYTGTSTGRILGIHGGSGDLKKFIGTYKKEVARFKAPGMQWPIIILADNDSGAAPLLNTIRDVTGQKPDRGDLYTHITDNLYLVLTPITQTTLESKIEDCFADVVKATILEGKPFDPNNEYNSETHYGKNDFANKVVKPNAKRIDFSGFKPIFDRFINVIKAHQRWLSGGP